MQADDSILLLANRFLVTRSVAAGYVHNLRNPVQSIMMAASSLDGDTSSDTAEQLIPIVQSEADRAHEYLNVLSDLFSEENDEPGPIPLEALLRQSADLGYAMRPRTGVEVSTELESSLPAVRGTGMDLLMITLNLLSNAKWATQGVAEPIVELTAVDDGQSVRVLVQNNGRPIPSDLAGDPFDAYVSNREGAIGIGLTASKILAARHGATLELASNQQSGRTTATLLLKKWQI